MHKKEYFITHIIKEQPPATPGDFQKVFFYTQTEKVSKKYFLGVDNNSYSQDYIDEQISLKKIFQVKKPIKLQDGTTLFVDHQGSYFIGNHQGLGEKVNVNESI